MREGVLESVGKFGGVNGGVGLGGALFLARCFVWGAGGFKIGNGEQGQRQLKTGNTGEISENKCERELCRGSCLYLCGVRVRYISELFLLITSGLLRFYSLSAFDGSP